jgi:hypothetical protein
MLFIAVSLRYDHLTNSYVKMITWQLREAFDMKTKSMQKHRIYFLLHA